MTDVKVFRNKLKWEEIDRDMEIQTERQKDRKTDREMHFS